MIGSIQTTKGDYFIMPKVVYTSTKGLVQEAGSGITFESLPSSAVQAITADTTVSLPGIYTISGSAIITVTMPPAATSPAGVYAFRNASVHAHVLTGSVTDAGVKMFCGTGTGTKITFLTPVGSGATMISDGRNFMVVGSSGSLAFSQA